MAFPSAWLDELLHKNDIVSVISEYVELKPKGRRLWACCPLHGEKTPSFSVSPDKQLFYCFGCHAGGTSIDFTMAYFHESSVDAAKRIVSAFGLGEVGAFDPDAGREARRFRDVTESVRRTASFFSFRRDARIASLSGDSSPGSSLSI